MGNCCTKEHPIEVFQSETEDDKLITEQLCKLKEKKDKIEAMIDTKETFDNEDFFSLDYLSDSSIIDEDLITDQEKLFIRFVNYFVNKRVKKEFCLFSHV